MRALSAILALFVVCLLQTPGFAYVEALAANVGSTGKYKPAVAFLCSEGNMPAMHRVVNGWEADPNTQCLEDLNDILNYCIKMYPDHDIRNVVEASEKVDIDNWPGQTHTVHRVTPFECIGDFESQALLVPQHCIFDHEHDNKKCERPANWTATAARHCEERSMVLESRGMLVVCGTDMFRGVEYVCCPKADKEAASEESAETEEASHSNNQDEDGEMDDYLAYLRGDDKFLSSKYEHEHDKFKAADRALKKREHEKITKMMKQWQVARDHVAVMRKTDAKGAEQLNRDIAEKFKKMYSAYEQEGQAAKKQLLRLHQQHVNGELNKEKREEMDAYVREINSDSPRASKLLHFLKRYIRTEERDRLHTVNHYEHLRDTDPEEAIRIRDQTKEHLSLITKRIEEAISMLQRHPDLAKKIEPEIAEFREKKFRNIEISSEDVVLKPVEEEKDEAPVTGGYDVVLDAEKLDSAETESKEAEGNHDYKNIQIDVEHPVVQEINNSPYVANAVRNPVAIESKEFNMRSAAMPYTAGNIAGIAIGSVAVFIIIIVAVVMLKKRSQRQPITHGFVEVDPAASPEERHVANMQMNGYENPTYRYFEMQ